MRPRSITSASSAVPKPGTRWPPPRMATAKPSARAALTAAMTSATPVQRTTTAGRLSIIALYTLRASSYRPSLGRITSPRTDPFSSVATFSVIIGTLPLVGTASYRAAPFNASVRLVSGVLGVMEPVGLPVVNSADQGVIRGEALPRSETMTSDPFEAFKASQREVWKSFAPLAQSTNPSAARLVRFSGVRHVQAVRDGGGEDGVCALTARRVGAVVTGVDLTPELLAVAKENAAIAEVNDIVWKQGDGEGLPFRDGECDVGRSQFAPIFAPRPETASHEMLLG